MFIVISIVVLMPLSFCLDYSVINKNKNIFNMRRNEGLSKREKEHTLVVETINDNR